MKGLVRPILPHGTGVEWAGRPAAISACLIRRLVVASPPSRAWGACRREYWWRISRVDASHSARDHHPGRDGRPLSSRRHCGRLSRHPPDYRRLARSRERARLSRPTLYLARLPPGGRARARRMAPDLRHQADHPAGISRPLFQRRSAGPDPKSLSPHHQHAPWQCSGQARGDGAAPGRLDGLWARGAGRSDHGEPALRPAERPRSRPWLCRLQCGRLRRRFPAGARPPGL